MKKWQVTEAIYCLIYWNGVKLKGDEAAIDYESQITEAKDEICSSGKQIIRRSQFQAKLQPVWVMVCIK